MIPDRIVEEVRARADIVEVIGQFVHLKKAGKEYKGLSPFKQERTPSFCVVPSKAFFHDFSSGESGDVFKFLMKHQGMSFVDAVKHVGARCGVKVVEQRRGADAEDVLRPYHETLAFAAGFFRESLLSAEGREARAYLERRGIDRRVAERWDLGFAPDGWSAFREAVAVHGLDESLLLEIGLLKKSEGREDAYDALRNRVVFPIKTVGGRVAGFGGRLLGKEGKGAPKYLNSPDSPVFHKGEVLYGLDRAKNHVRREECALLVEGFMDVVALDAVGVSHAVAPLGTALTEAHAALLSRYAKETRILFDSDPAGLRATFRAADVLLAHGVHPSVATLPDGEDPDSVARAGGAAAVKEFVGQAVDVLDRKVAILQQRDYFSSIEKRRAALDRLLPTLRAVRDPALRDMYLGKVSELTGVAPKTLAAEIERSREIARVPARPAPRTRRRPAGRLHGRGPDRTLLLLLLRDRTWIDRAAEMVSAADLEDRACRAIFETLIDDPELKAWPQGADPEAGRRFEELMADAEELVPASRVFHDVVAKIRTRELDRRNVTVPSCADDAEKARLAKEKEELVKQKNAVCPDWGKVARVAGDVRQERFGAR